IEAGDVPVFNVGATEDAVVPYEYGMAGIDPVWIAVEGPKPIHERAVQVGVKAELLTFYGAGHVPFVPNANNPQAAAYLDTTLNFIVESLHPLVCPSPADRNRSLSRNQIAVFPNPAENALCFVFCRPPETLQIFDPRGRLVRSLRPQGSTFELSVADLNPGLYFYTASDGKSGRFVVRR
ncbi:MAG: T9SS type A sorting domain-containing protein, partial [Bacteroidia bacterium]|nr:T9SS type A sorting domain-containing protein [Bacteroidia bacterium]MDW8334526.1 T9SS type A sorting domain-containing protein [Bacteroidia bacterium]